MLRGGVLSRPTTVMSSSTSYILPLLFMSIAFQSSNPEKPGVPAFCKRDGVIGILSRFRVA
jgi:hypothetical protein